MIMKEIKNMSKFKISQNYMETEKQKHPALEKNMIEKELLLGQTKQQILVILFLKN